LAVRLPIGERQRIGRRDLRVALAEGAAIDEQAQARRRAEPTVMAAAPADAERTGRAGVTVGLAAGGTMSGLRLERAPRHPYPARAVATARIGRRSESTKVATRDGAPGRSPSSTRRANALPTITA